MLFRSLLSNTPGWCEAFREDRMAIYARCELLMEIEHLIRYAPRTVGLMKIKNINRYSPLAVGLKPSAIQGKARLRGLYRI